MKKGRRITQLIFISLSLVNSACSQYIFLLESKNDPHVIKKDCEFKGSSGYKLILSLKNKNIEKTSGLDNYGLSEFIGLSDSLKLKIVKELLQYKDDTSVVCIPVEDYGYQGYENTCKSKPLSKRYNIQIDALFLINKLCFPHASSFYYCYPVLFDTQTGKEINNNFMAIGEVFKIYTNWYSDTMLNGTISKEFPFSKGRYIWYGAVKGISDGE